MANQTSPSMMGPGWNGTCGQILKILFLMERGRLCNELRHLPVVLIICLETEFGKDGFNVPGQVS